MNQKSKKNSLVILGLTAIIFSRAMFLFIDDPEGPNLLIVVVLAAIIYFLSLAVSLFNPFTKNKFPHKTLASLADHRRLFEVILVQIVLVTALYLLTVLGF